MPEVRQRWEKWMRDVKRGALTAAVGAVVIALAGCGVVDSVRYPYAKEDPDKIFGDALKATTELEAVRVSGFVEGRRGPRINFNLLNAEDGSCGGTMAFGTADFDVVITPKQTYIKGSAGSWQQMPGLPKEVGIVAAPVLADRWVTGAAEKGVDPNPLCDVVNVLTKPEQGDDEDKYDVTNKGLVDVAGVKAVQIEAVSDKTRVDVWVDVEEPHHLVKLVLEEKKQTVDIVLSDFDFGGSVPAPRKKDVLDTTQLTAEDFNQAG